MTNAMAHLVPVASAAGFLAATALKTTVLLAAAFGAALVLRRASSAVRHRVWTAGLLAVLLLPLLAVGLPWRFEIRAPAPGALAAVVERALPAADARPGAPAVTDGAGDGVEAPGPASAASRGSAVRGSVAGSAAAAAPPASGSAQGAVSSAPARRGGGLPGGLAGVLVAVWAIGVLVVIGRAVRGLAALRGFRRGSRPAAGPAVARLARQAAARLGVTGIEVRESRDVDVPLTLGVLRPAILLPAEAGEWDDDRLWSVLLHEMAHVRRRDPLQHLLARVACALHWYNPLVWLAARRQRRESERACDDLVLESGVRPSAYATHLLHVASAGTGRPVPALVSSMARRSDFEGRLLQVLDAGARRSGVSARAGAVVTVAAVAVTLVVASLAAATGGPDVAVAAADADERSPLVVDERSALVADERSPLVVDALVPLLDDPDPEVRAAAARSLGENGARAAVPRLTRALSDADARVRRRAAQALGELEDDRAIGALAERLLRDDAKDVRRAAAWALGETETDEAVRVLAEAIGELRDRKTRVHAVEALGETRRAAAVPVLEALLDERDGWVRSRALDALVEIGTPSAARVLVRMLESDDARLRRKAATALGGWR